MQTVKTPVVPAIRRNSFQPERVAMVSIVGIRVRVGNVATNLDPNWCQFFKLPIGFLNWYLLLSVLPIGIQIGSNFFPFDLVSNWVLLLVAIRDMVGNVATNLDPNWYRLYFYYLPGFQIGIYCWH
jgi:hypothetical protein